MLVILAIFSFTFYLGMASPESQASPHFEEASPVCPLWPKIQLENPLRIAAWNAQKLGKRKMKNSDVVDVLVRVMLRYDIIVLQEIVDYTLESPYELLDKLNEAAYYKESDYDPDDALEERAYDIFEIAVSDRLGRSRYKEQYAFYYREDRVILNQTYQYPDPKDIFQIEPFVAVFETPTAKVERLALIPIHTSPGDAKEEIDALVDVYDDVFQQLHVEDALILGDFNAGCTYVLGSEWESIRLRMDERFSWLISDHLDTTTKGTSCPYDRIVATGSSLVETIYEQSARPFYFDEEFDIIDKEFIHDVSDHYPVEVSLQGELKSSSESKSKIEVGITVELDSIEWAIDSMIRTCLGVEEAKKKAEAEAQDDELFFEEENELTDDKDVEKKSFLQKIFSPFVKKKEEDVEKTGRTEKGSVPVKEEIVEDLRCGRNPYIVKEDSGIFILEFQSANLTEVVSLIDILSAKHKCVFNNQATEVLKYKLRHGVLSDASLYGEVLPDGLVRTRLLCIQQYSCTLFLTKETSVL